jgi:endonuclease/exonuclease/phosphatase family metal-dependent hydrolase
MKIRRAGLWLLVLPGLVWAVLRLFGWERGFLVQAFAFTPYVAAWTLIPAIITLATKRWAAAGAALTAVAIMAWCVLPRALPDVDKGPSEGTALTVMTINMFIGAADPAAIVKLVRDHDVAVLAVQEFSPTARMGLSNAGLDVLLPHAALADEVGTTGSGLYSRFPISASHSERGGGGNMQVYATIQPPGTTALDVVSAHPLAPYSTKVLNLWKGDLDAEPEADVLMGDFNSTLDHTPVRRLIAAHGYRDAADATGKGLLGTWGPYHGKLVPPVTLDHVLAGERIGIKDVQVHAVKGSDHRSVIATLVVAAGR